MGYVPSAAEVADDRRRFMKEQLFHIAVLNKSVFSGTLVFVILTGIGIGLLPSKEAVLMPIIFFLSGLLVYATINNILLWRIDRKIEEREF